MPIPKSAQNKLEQLSLMPNFRLRTKKSYRQLVFALTLPLLIISCSGSHYGAAKLSSVPDGAEVINIDTGTVLGVTPTEVWWESGSGKKQLINVRLRKAGFYDKLATFWLSMRHSSSQAALNNAQKVEVNLIPKPQ